MRKRKEGRGLIKLKTRKLLLRPFVRSDLDDLAQINSASETRGFGWVRTMDNETTALFLQKWIEEYKRGLGHLAMIYEPDSALIGHCGLTEQGGRVVLAYALHKDYWCRGLAPEACNAILEYGFGVLRVEEIWTETQAKNYAWRSMMEKLGMTLRETKLTNSGVEVHYAASRVNY